MKRLRRFALALVLGLAATAGPATAQVRSPRAARTATIAFLDVGQGDAILIRSPEGKTALVDAGPHKELAVDLLRRRGVTALDLVVLSHHHADHYGGMGEVVRTFRPRFFLDSGSSQTTPHYLRLLEQVRANGVVAIRPTDRPRRIGLGSVALTVFPQAPEHPNDENDNSVGLRLDYGDFSALLPGDAGRSERDWWEKHAASLCAEATVLKLAHHGSNNGTDARWLGLVRPRLAVASVGKDNEYGHPGAEAVALLARSGIPLLRTDRDGTVVVETDGRRWWVTGWPHVAAGRLARGGRPKARRDGKVPPAGRPINVNTATLGELEALPGIGPVIARRIVEGRPYRSVAELGRVKEIGPKRLEEIRHLIAVD